METLLSVKDLHHGFGAGGTRLEVLTGVDFEVAPGELVALMGPSGCGKSTLLNIIGGLLAADSGTIDANGCAYGQQPPHALVELRRATIGWIFQDFHLLPHLSALDNVTLALELAGAAPPDAEQHAAAALERVGLADRAQHRPDELSGGQAQRVAIARAIAGDRKLLLADEPTGNLDVATSREILELFHELCAGDSELSILMVTHDAALAARADRMLLLRDGRVAASDVESAWGEAV
ncbi:MAG: ABC transporter ATP-binding protein [Candidatus Poseidoniia archaeon]|jgi:putative ABC transport system ATP-binding protein|nr:ABC transporter ATP-binding protein [Candidatus Poseidoniia archaeon]